MSHLLALEIVLQYMFIINCLCFYPFDMNYSKSDSKLLEVQRINSSIFGVPVTRA